jgi:hypothetical protein
VDIFGSLVFEVIKCSTILLAKRKKAGECPKGWAKCCFATEITEFTEKNSKVSHGTPWHRTPGQVCARGKCEGSVAKPTKLDTPKSMVFSLWLDKICILYTEHTDNTDFSVE